MENNNKTHLRLGKINEHSIDLKSPSWLDQGQTYQIIVVNENGNSLSAELKIKEAAHNCEYLYFNKPSGLTL